MSNKYLEIEMRFDNIDTNQLRKKLKSIGAKISKDKRIMPLVSFNHPKKKKNTYIRIRDEGEEVTLTFKNRLNEKYPVEREVVISDFDEGVAILKLIGCKERYYIEKLRETWKIDGCKEIVIDSYPGLPEYIEIECDTEKNVFNTAKKLGIKINKNHKNPKVENMYLHHYGITRKRELAKRLTFKNGLDIFDKYITKNRKQFITILKEQQKYIKK